MGRAVSVLLRGWPSSWGVISSAAGAAGRGGVVRGEMERVQKTHERLTKTLLGGGKGEEGRWGGFKNSFG